MYGVEGLPVWEHYRRNEVRPSEMLPPVTLTRDGGVLLFNGVRQACDGMGCSWQSPGLFISRAPGPRSPAYAPVVFIDDVPTAGFDVRLALVEADADGGLRSFVNTAGGDLGTKADTFFSLGADMLVVQLSIGREPTGTRLTVQRATCATPASALLENFREERSGEFTTPLSVLVPHGAGLEWGLDSFLLRREFVVFANGQRVLTWQFSASRLMNCGNSDDAGYSDGFLDPSRLTAVMYVGRIPVDDARATLIMSFTGYAPRFIGAPSVPVLVSRSQSREGCSSKMAVSRGSTRPSSSESNRPAAPQPRRLFRVLNRREPRRRRWCQRLPASIG
jgi:hypothetical protein